MFWTLCARVLGNEVGIEGARVLQVVAQGFEFGWKASVFFFCYNSSSSRAAPDVGTAHYSALGAFALGRLTACVGMYP